MRRLITTSRGILATVAIGIHCALLTSAHAGELPRYDVKAWCHELATSGGSFSEVLYGTCMDQEQSAYNQLKEKWTTAPAKTRQWCDELARAGGGAGSYTLLQTCLDQELRAADENKTKTFEY